MNYIVPVDFSFNSKMTADDAASMASRNGGTVHLVHVIMKAEEENHFLPVRTLAAKRNTVYEIISYQESLRRKFNIRTSCDIVPGMFVPEVKKAFRRNSGDVVVVGMQGETGLKKYLFGSNSTALMMDSGLPVMVLPVKKRNITEQKVLFLTDFRVEEVEHLSWIKSLLAVENLSFVLAHTEESNNTKREEFENALLNNHTLSTSDVQFIGNTTINDAASAERLVKEVHADLLVVPASQRSMLDGLTGRSLSQDFVPSLEIPLLVIP